MLDARNLQLVFLSPFNPHPLPPAISSITVAKPKIKSGEAGGSMASIIGAAAGGGGFVLIMIIIIIVVVVVKKNRRRGAQGHGLPTRGSRADSSHVQMDVKGVSEMHMNPLGQQGKDDALVDAKRADSSHVQVDVKGVSEMHVNPMGQRGKDDALVDAKGHPDNRIL